jgi:ankyrin repeat protein
MKNIKKRMSVILSLAVFGAGASTPFAGSVQAMGEEKVAAPSKEELNAQLLKAVEETDFEEVKRLLDLGADRAVLNAPLIAAQEKSDFQTAGEILDLGVGRAELNEWFKKKSEDLAELNEKLLEAVKNNTIDEVRNLLVAGANVDALCFKSEVYTSNPDGITPLHWAAYCGHTEIVKLLLENGATMYPIYHYSRSSFPWPNTMSICNTPIESAAAFGHVEVVELLLEAEKEAIAKAETYKAAEEHATTAAGERMRALEGREPTDQELTRVNDDWYGVNARVNIARELPVGVVPDGVASDYWCEKSRARTYAESPLRHAVERRRKEVVEFLLASDCYCNSQEFKNDALITAAENGSGEMLELLHKNGTYAQSVTHNALIAAASKANAEALKVLFKYTTYSHNSQVEALIAAASFVAPTTPYPLLKKCQDETMAVLLDAKADLESAIARAESMGKQDCVDSLRAFLPKD